MEQVRINVRRLSVYVLMSLVLPLAGALLLDLSLGSLPWLTIGATVIFIPLSSVLVVRATLAELDSVIQAVAPLDADNPE